MSEEIPSIRREFKLHTVLLGGALLTMWMLEVTDLWSFSTRFATSSLRRFSRS